MSAAEIRPKLGLASYNVHGCVGTDGRRDVPRIARVLRALNAQVIALQEVIFCLGESGQPEPIDLLAELSGFQAVCAPIARRGDPYFGNALLTTLPIVRAERLDLNFGRYEPRTALDVWLEVEGHALRVIATHLGLRPAERRYQVRRLLEHVTHTEESTTVLLGDFNEWFLAGRPLRWLHSHFGKSPARATYPSQWPVLSLDRVWVHPKQRLEDVQAYRAGEAEWASDHLPLVASLQL